MKLAGQPTRFPDRAGGPAARMAAFAAHLRDTGIKIGVGQTGTALRALAAERGSVPIWRPLTAAMPKVWLAVGRS